MQLGTFKAGRSPSNYFFLAGLTKLLSMTKGRMKTKSMRIRKFIFIEKNLSFQERRIKEVRSGLIISGYFQ